MTIGDIFEKTRLAMGGEPKDEQDLRKLREVLLSLQDLRAGARKKKDALDRVIKDKQAELAATTLRQNQVSLAKEILSYKNNLNELQKTEDEISRKIDVADALIHEKEREINAKRSKEAGIDISKVELATDKREDRLADEADLSKALDGLLASGGKQTSESAEDIDALLAAAMSSDTVKVKPQAAKSDPEAEDLIAAAAASTSGPAAAAPKFELGVATLN